MRKLCSQCTHLAIVQTFIIPNMLPIWDRSDPLVHRRWISFGKHTYWSYRRIVPIIITPNLGHDFPPSMFLFAHELVILLPSVHPPPSRPVLWDQTNFLSLSVSVKQKNWKENPRTGCFYIKLSYDKVCVVDVFINPWMRTSPQGLFCSSPKAPG